MADINTLDQGAKILQNVDVSSMVTALALGIATAQERLDNNSISQLIRLSETEVAGKSLLEFGFQPAFYAFDHADISASINLKMALKEETEVDFSVAVDYQKNTTFDKDFFNQLKRSRNKSLSRYSKTEKDISLEAKHSKEVGINEKSLIIHREQGSYSKVEKAKEQMRDAATGLRVDSVIEDQKILRENTSNAVFIAKQEGYVVITEPYIHNDVEGLLKMGSDTDEDPPDEVEITLAADTKFIKEEDFKTTLKNARTTNDTGDVVGINAGGIHRSNVRKEWEFFFDWDVYNIDYSYSTRIKQEGLNEDDVTKLAMLLKNDATLNITITGYTDGSGNTTKENADYNNALGKKRANALRNELSNKAGMVLPEERVRVDTKGEALANGSSAKDPNIRKVKIGFPAAASDYILFNGGKITMDATPKTPDAWGNHFVYVEEGNTAENSGLDIKFNYDGKDYVLRDSAKNELSSLTNNKGVYEELYLEKVNETYYALHKKNKVNYFVHTGQNTEIDVTVANKASADIDKETTKIYVGETTNDLTKLKKSSKDFKGDRSLAISGSLDVRSARQFGMSIEGNASVSARMISIPPPIGLENYIQSLTGNAGTTED